MRATNPHLVIIEYVQKQQFSAILFDENNPSSKICLMQLLMRGIQKECARRNAMHQLREEEAINTKHNRTTNTYIFSYTAPHILIFQFNQLDLSHIAVLIILCVPYETIIPKYIRKDIAARLGAAAAPYNLFH